MACPSILTGEEFVTRMVTHIDCQSRYLGSYGFEALAQPGSSAAVMTAGLLTLLVAIWAWRLLFGPVPEGRDLAGDLLKVGIVLTLAFSWPAFRTLVHDVALDGPAEIATALSNPGITSGGTTFTARLQRVDNAVLALIDSGTGRWGSQYLEGQRGVANFSGTTFQDDSAFGWSRLIYLSGLIGSLGLLRLVAGLLLALAPLAAGMLLFEATRGLFAGWLRGLLLTLIGSVGITVVLAVELAVLEPFLADAIYVRSSGYAAPGVPIELFAMTTGFALVQLLTIWLLAKVAFTRGWASAVRLPALVPQAPWMPAPAQGRSDSMTVLPTRAERVAEQVESRMSFERNRMVSLPAPLAAGGAAMSPAESARAADPASVRMTLPDRLGSSYRRASPTRSLTNRSRDA